MFVHKLGASLWLALVLSCPAFGAESLPARQAGELDIHHISTGLGDQTLFVMPDGTTLLVDTGDVASFFSETGQDPPRFVPRPRPDASRSAGEWVARYIERAIGATKLDYLLVTHFHPDHMRGLGDVASRIEVDLVLDRGWPEYEGLVPVPNAVLSAYRQMVDGSTLARFRPGRADQIVLRKDGSAYPTFEIRNLTANGEYWTGEGDETRTANGEYWTGEGDETRTRFPSLSELTDDDYPTENTCSVSFRLRYGAFAYYTGGDLTACPTPGIRNGRTWKRRSLNPSASSMCTHSTITVPTMPRASSFSRSSVRAFM